MALYSYQAFSRAGKKKSGILDASSVAHAREQLVKTGLFPTKIVLATQETTKGFSFLSLFRRGVSAKDRIFFTKQLAVLLRSGVPLLEALDLLSEQSSRALRSIIISLKDTIKEGRSLADGLSQFPKVFENIYIQLVRAGEASGRLEVILERLTEYLERRAELRKKIRGVLTYPIIQLTVIVVVVSVLLIKVVPTIMEVFESQNAQLPFATQMLMGISAIFTDYYIFLLIGIVLLIPLFLWWKSTTTGKRTLDRIKLHLPIIKYFTKMGAVIQFSRTLGMLLEAGVNLSEALNIVVKIVNNQILVDALNQARENIIKQGKIAHYLKETNLFPSVAIYLINTGEQSGQLDAMLLTVAQNYESELNDYADRLSELLDPFMLVLMALIVGFIILSIALPMMNLGDMLSV